MMERPDLKQALGRLLGPVEPEVGCEVCFEELDRYAELAREDVDAAIPGLRGHLDGCPACREEHESLRALVGGTQASNRADVRRSRGGDASNALVRSGRARRPRGECAFRLTTPGRVVGVRIGVPLCLRDLQSVALRCSAASCFLQALSVRCPPLQAASQDF
jgi:hypothetical protein